LRAGAFFAAVFVAFFAAPRLLAAFLMFVTFFAAVFFAVGLLRGRLLRRRLALPAEAPAQQGHDIDHVAGLRRRLLLRLGLLRVAGLDLALDERHQVVAIRVLELLGLEGRLHLGDQALGHLELGRGELHLLAALRRQVELRRLAQLVVVAQQLQHQRGPADHQHRDRLARADHHPRHPDLVGLAQHLAQQHVRLQALLRGHQVVRLFEQHRLDRAGVGEVDDVDRLRRLDVGPLEVLLLDHDVLAVGVLVALDDVVPLDDLLGAAVKPLIAHRAHVAAIEQVEVDVVARLGGVQTDGDLHQAEADRTFPNCAGGHTRLSNTRSRAGNPDSTVTSIRRSARSSDRNWRVR
jgi:hypothetical protein